ncbi:acetate kinase [Lacticaseibacillus pabuli]|uniref:Acetate kinase n=1 Tax=Lacticaseibacillus pabuli TaxID=3025672 RepID=A0ABY7WVC5_9LACO|nr:acetate kinase [Lacticaseibacillus sp. KACC 23028]WDF82927.1 acetate kinase [Lacticaseibacillus sp. KACC 23028]
MSKILSVNSGSSTLKWRLFDMPSGEMLGKGLIDRVNEPISTVTIQTKDDKKTYEAKSTDCGALVSDMLSQMKAMHLVNRLHEIVGVGHRVVAGGETFSKSVVVDQDTLVKINNLRNLAPLHNAAEASFIKTFSNVLPWATEVAVFDSAFHSTLPEQNYLYGINYDYYRKYGVRKFGAHGTSVRYVSRRAADFLGRDLKDLKMVVLHLGAGSSATAVVNGKSFDTSMGFTPLSGLMGATRSGDIDVSLVTYLQNKLGVSSSEMIEKLNHDSGLLGVSELSGDQRTLKEASDNHQAQLALEMYANAVVKYLGSYIAEMNGIDAIVFAGGVGENSYEMRSQIMSHFNYVGATIDEKKNKTNGQEIDISAADAKVRTLVIPTDEELMIARDTYGLIEN